MRIASFFVPGCWALLAYCVAYGGLMLRGAKNKAINIKIILRHLNCSTTNDAKCTIKYTDAAVVRTSSSPR